MQCVGRLWQRCPLCLGVGVGLKAGRNTSVRGLHATGSRAAGKKKVVVVHKTSRLEFEKMKQPHLSESEIKNMLVVGGVDYGYLQERQRIHTGNLAEIQTYLRSQGCEVVLKNRETFSEQDVHWADIIIAAGGDGNFLYTASKVHSPDKLVVGINTDPQKSEGFLCLGSGSSPSEVLSDVLRGLYRERRRHRIRVSLGAWQLPVLALNEVFVGEKDVSHSSYYEFCHDASPMEKHKSSGLLVYTGSGSTSWAYNMNKVNAAAVQRMLEIAIEQGATLSLPPHLTTWQLAQLVSEMYISGMVFSGEKPVMAFTVREPIVRGIFAVGCSHGHAKRVKVVSRSWNAHLVVDGHYHRDFPNGTTAQLEIHSQDSLQTLY